MNTQQSYKRLLLKLSGETLNGSQSFGINHDTVKKLALSLKSIREEGFQLAIVIGGGNIFRGVNLKDSGIARTPADHIGMLATLMNGIVLQQALLIENCPASVMSALECPKVAESYNWSKALSLLEKGEVLIFVGGTGNPYFTTDTAAAMRANEIQADVFLKATKVNGVYNKDPLKDTNAVKYATVTYSQVLAEKLGIMDSTAIALCRDSGTPIFVFNMDLLGKEKMRDLLSKKMQGTLIQAENSDPAPINAIKGEKN